VEQYLLSTHPYSFGYSLKRLQDLPRQVIGRVEDGPSYVRTLVQGDRVGLVRISDAGPAGLRLTVEGDLDPALTVATVRRALSLDLDHDSFLRHVEQADPVIAGLARRFLGARPIGPFSLWEALVWTVIAQQINLTFAYSLKEALVRLGGQSYLGYLAIPSPERVAQLDYGDLQAQKYSRRKAEYVIDLARAVASGQLDLGAVVALPFGEAVERLVAFRGIGRWTAECLLMDAGHLTAFPAGDIGIRNAVQRFYGLDHQPTEAEVRELGRAWAPYSALACYYLWLGLLDRG